MILTIRSNRFIRHELLQTRDETEIPIVVINSGEINKELAVNTIPNLELILLAVAVPILIGGVIGSIYYYRRKIPIKTTTKTERLNENFEILMEPKKRIEVEEIQNQFRLSLFKEKNTINQKILLDLNLKEEKSLRRTRTRSPMIIQQRLKKPHKKTSLKKTKSESSLKKQTTIKERRRRRRREEGSTRQSIRSISMSDICDESLREWSINNNNNNNLQVNNDEGPLEWYARHLTPQEDDDRIQESTCCSDHQIKIRNRFQSSPTPTHANQSINSILSNSPNLNHQQVLNDLSNQEPISFNQNSLASHLNEMNRSRYSASIC